MLCLLLFVLLDVMGCFAIVTQLVLGILMLFAFMYSNGSDDGDCV